jgi:hypothetical protein
MPKYGSRETAAGQGLLRKLLKESEFDSEFLKTLPEVFISVCRTLEVSDPADPWSNTIAHTVIILAAEGERDPVQLYRRAIAQICRKN